MILAFALALLGLFWSIYGLLSYSWWGSRGPGNGFFPVLVGAALFIIATVEVSLIFSIKKKQNKEEKFNWFPYCLLGSSLVTIVASLLIGFFPALFIYCLFWMRFFEKFTWGKTIIVAVVIFIAVYGIFVLGLKTPFPNGLLVRSLLLRG